MFELGIRRINTLSLDPDRNRSIDQFGALAEMAAVHRPDVRLLVDTVHIVRGGGTAADLSELDPDTVGYIQLSDAPLHADGSSPYYEEAMFERMVPGTGELPVLDLLAAVPRDLVVGLEIPIRSHAQSGIGPDERLDRCVAAARHLLAQLDELE